MKPRSSPLPARRAMRASRWSPPSRPGRCTASRTSWAIRAATSAVLW